MSQIAFLKSERAAQTQADVELNEQPGLDLAD